MVKLVNVIWLLLLVACQSTEPLPEFSPSRFNHLPTYQFKISGIDIKDFDLESSAPISPTSALHTWVNDRIVATGSSHHKLNIIIEDASIISKPLEQDHSLQSTFTDQQSEKLTTNLSVKFELYGDQILLPKAEMSINVSRSKTLNEKASIADRNTLLYELVKSLINDFNSQFDHNVRNYFSDYLD